VPFSFNPLTGGFDQINDLQGAYDISSDPMVTVATSPGAVTIRDGSPSVAPFFRLQNNAGTIDLFSVRTTGVNQVNIGNLSALGPNSPVISIDDTSSTIMLWGSSGSITFTTSPGFMIQYAMTAIHNYANVSYGALALQGIVEHQQAGFAFNHYLLFNNGNTYRNQAGVAVSFGPGQAFIDQPSIQVNGSVALTMSQLRSFLSQPAFVRTTAGVGTLTVTTVSQFQAFGSVGTGITITTWNRIELGNFTTFTGTVTTFRHIRMENVTGPTTVIGLSSVMTAGTFIDHTGTAPVNLGGLLNLGAGATVDVSLSRGAANRLDLASGDSFRIVIGNMEVEGEYRLGAGGVFDWALSRLAANIATLADGDSLRITTGSLFMATGGTVALSATVANRLDLATGDSFRVVGGNVEIDGSLVLGGGGTFDWSVSRTAVDVASLAAGDSLRLAPGTGRVDFAALDALGGGAGATLGTIGGAGPTAAAQATWLPVRIAGVVHWLPAWV